MFWGLPDDRGLPDVAQGRQKTHETHLKMLSKLIMIAFWGLPGDWGLPDVAQGRQKAKDGRIYMQFSRCLMIGMEKKPENSFFSENDRSLPVVGAPTMFPVYLMIAVSL